MLMRFDPFRELDRLGEELDRATAPRVVPMDAIRRGGHLLVTVDLPGVRAEDVDLSVERNMLTIQAERHRDTAEGDEILMSERRHGTFTRQLMLGDALDTDHIQADCHDGVLEVRIPVADTAKARRITVNGAGEIAGMDENPQAITA